MFVIYDYLPPVNILYREGSLSFAYIPTNTETQSVKAMHRIYVQLYNEFEVRGKWFISIF